MQATAMAERVAAAQAELDAVVERADRAGGVGERLVASGWRSLVDAVRAPDAAWPAVEAVIGGELSEASSIGLTDFSARFDAFVGCPGSPVFG